MGTLKAILFFWGILSFAVLTGHDLSLQDGFRQVEDPDALVERLNENSLKIETIQSTFIQKKQLEFLDETIISKGSFSFRKENSLRWAYHEPFEYVIVIHGGKFLIRDGEQVSTFDIESNPAFTQINNLIVGMVSGNISGEEFEMEAFENSTQYLVRLLPRESTMKEVISTMEIYFDKSDLAVAEVRMEESEKDYTVITFIDKKINEPIEEAVFSTDY
ncbi:MAG: outer membrane lipoprotein carrier protein LolA [Bacteroidetes bacterium]|nr:outer membrane lipoprotein carrier protein LolA [Bacteroidota bacterium]